MNVSALLRTFLDTGLAYRAWFETEITSHADHWTRTGGSHEPRLLLLAWFLPPLLSGGVFRPTSFLRYGPEYGWQVSALSGPLPHNIDPAGQYLLDNLPRQENIERFVPVRLKPSYRWFPRMDVPGTGFLKAIASHHQARRKWQPRPPSVILASGPPFHNFIAAYYLARSFGAKLVLDYRDEWTESPHEQYESGPTSRKWEARCITAADLILFTTQSQLDHQINAFPLLKHEKTRVLTNGWDPIHFGSETNRHARPPELDKKIVLTFTGYLGPHTMPDDFFSALSRMSSRNPTIRDLIRLRFVGSRNDRVNSLLDNFPNPEMLIVLDHVPKPVANRLKQESDALLLCTKPSLTRYLPGKLFEYLAAGPPVLVYGFPGEASALVKRLNGGYVVAEGDDEGLERAFTDIADRAFGVAPPWDRSSVERWLIEHTRERLSARLFSMIDALKEGKSVPT